MPDVMNKTTFEVRESVHGLDPRYKDNPDWWMWDNIENEKANFPACAKKYWKDGGGSYPVEMDQTEKDPVDAAEANAAAAAAADRRDLLKNTDPTVIEAFKEILNRQNAIITVVKSVAPGPGADLSTMTPAQLLAAVDARLQA